MADESANDGRNFPNPKDKILLYSVACRDDWFPIQYYEQLVADGANPNCKDPDGRSPLHQCSTPIGRPDTKLMEFFIRRGADVNSRDGAGCTPLSLYCRKQTLTREAAELLISAGADVNIRNFRGETILHQVADFQNESILDILKLVIEKTADLNVIDVNGRTPLMIFLENKSQHDNSHSLELLLRSGCDVNMKWNGQNILYRFFLLMNSFIFDLFNDRGAYAMFCNYVNLLCIHGVDVNFKEKNRRTPIDMLLGCRKFNCWSCYYSDYCMNCICLLIKYMLIYESDIWKSYRPKVERGVGLCDEKISNYLAELAKMKTFTIKDGVTLHDFCTSRGGRELGRYLENSTLMHEKPANLKELFPNYFVLIEHRIGLGLEWVATLEKLATVSLCSKCFGDGEPVMLTWHCFSLVQSYLGKRDLCKLIEAASIV